MTSNSKRSALGGVLTEPRTFVARLILAELITKRGQGPLRRPVLVYTKRKR